MSRSLVVRSNIIADAGLATTSPAAVDSRLFAARPCRGWVGGVQVRTRELPTVGSTDGPAADRCRPFICLFSRATLAFNLPGDECSILGGSEPRAVDFHVGFVTSTQLPCRFQDVLVDVVAAAVNGGKYILTVTLGGRRSRAGFGLCQCATHTHDWISFQLKTGGRAHARKTPGHTMEHINISMILGCFG